MAKKKLHQLACNNIKSAMSLRLISIAVEKQTIKMR